MRLNYHQSEKGRNHKTTLCSVSFNGQRRGNYVRILRRQETFLLRKVGQIFSIFEEVMA